MRSRQALPICIPICRIYTRNKTEHKVLILDSAQHPNCNTITLLMDHPITNIASWNTTPFSQHAKPSHQKWGLSLHLVFTASCINRRKGTMDKTIKDSSLEGNFTSHPQSHCITLEKCGYYTQTEQSSRSISSNDRPLGFHQITLQVGNYCSAYCREREVYPVLTQYVGTTPKKIRFNKVDGNLVFRPGGGVDSE